MDLKRKSVRVTVVFFAALAAGHFLQIQSRYSFPAASAARPSNIETVSAGPDALRSALGAEADQALALFTEGTSSAEGAASEPVIPGQPSALAPHATQPQDCTEALSLTPRPGAMLALTLQAPCRAGERVVLRHAALVFAEALDVAGRLQIALPALEAGGEVIAQFKDKSQLTAAAAITDLATYHRFGVQWVAEDAFQLHALEQGAGYGQPGDLHAEHRRSAAGGHIDLLGDPRLDLPLLAQLYSFPQPIDATQTEIAVDLMVEAEVTPATCGRELLGETLSLRNGRLTVTELSLTMPLCDAIGDRLVLKNPLPDRTLASIE